ncbi:MAG: geranylgeranyl reductase family protein [Desulfobacterales bacterium]|nr:MAG: geranylgeranyl reductase family protein [Desulfobacterales bacterium]
MNSIAKKKNSFDVVVIGAGPAGATAAYLLASKGFKILIVEKSTFPRDKLCGGLLTLKTVKLLESIYGISLDDMKNQRIITYQSFNYKVGSSKGGAIKGRLDYPFHFVQRSVYDAFWLEMAQKAGAEFRAGEKAVALDISSKKLTTNKGYEIYGNYILAADGALSRTRRLLSTAGLIKPDRQSEMATTLEVFISNRHIPEQTDYPAIYFGYIPWGYSWNFPGEHFRILGIVGLNVKAGRFLRKGFRTFLKSLNISVKRFPPFRSHALPYGSFLSDPGYSNVLLLGDACGLVDPFLGEGLYYAHKSAQLAARALLKSYDDSQAVLKCYRRCLEQNIIAELKRIRMIRRIIFTLPGNWPYRILSFILETMPKPCEEALQGDRPVKWLRPGCNEKVFRQNKLCNKR